MWIDMDLSFRIRFTGFGLDLDGFIMFYMMDFIVFAQVTVSLVETCQTCTVFPSFG